MSTDRLTQLGVEVTTTADVAPVRVSQLDVEALAPATVPARVTQTAVELENVTPALTRVSQTVVEILTGLAGPMPSVYQQEDRIIRRLRRAPDVANENLRTFYKKFELDLERGVGLPTGQGEDPQVMLRLSRDGGQTWGEPMLMSAGRLGVYTQRVIARRLGHARDVVFEITVSDPVAWSIVQAWLDVEPGTS